MFEFLCLLLSWLFDGCAESHLSWVFIIGFLFAQELDYIWGLNKKTTNFDPHIIDKKPYPLRKYQYKKIKFIISYMLKGRQHT